MTKNLLLLRPFNELAACVGKTSLQAGLLQQNFKID
jgi:hypothetical protein